MKNQSIFIKTIILLSIFFISFSSYAQRQSTTLALLGGYSDSGFGAMINYNYFISQRTFVQGSAYFSSNKAQIKGRDYKLPYNNFTINAGYFGEVYGTSRETFHINLGGGGIGGYEVINRGSNTLESGALILDKSKFIYGVYASAEFVVYINNNLSFITKLNEFYHVNSDLGNFTFFGGVGIRYYIY